MPKIDADKRKAARRAKYDALYKRLKNENPEIWKQFLSFRSSMEKLWTNCSPFVGDEEDYGRLAMRMSETGIRGTAFNTILWFSLLKIMSDKFDKEFKWFRKNKKILEMMVKEYIAQGEHR